MTSKPSKPSKRKYAKKQKIAGLIVGGLAFLVVIPSILALASPPIDAKLNLPKPLPEPLNLIVAPSLIIPGLLLVAWSGFTQLKIGRGTPVPAIPTQRLVTTGPYALCRNPMLLGTIIYYLGISLWINSPTAVLLTTLFSLCSIAYVKLVEENELKAKFGKEYEEYKRKVPFLIPRLRKTKQTAFISHHSCEPSLSCRYAKMAARMKKKEANTTPFSFKKEIV